MLPFLDGFTWKPIFEIRERLERRVDRDFSGDRSDNTSDLLGRYRAGVSFKSGTVSGKVVYQYAHGEDWNHTQNFSTERSDLLVAFAQAKLGDGNLTLGRQKFAFGTERLIGAAEWNNISNSWDGGNFTTKNLDFFAAKSGLLSTPNDQVSIYGATAKFGTSQLLGVFKHDENGTGVDEFTLSEQFRGKVGPVTIDAEAAGQAGHRGDVKKLAGAFDVVATMPVAKKLTLGLQGSVAGGGGNGDTNRTFDQLYPSSHDKHGLMDMTGWKNMRELALSLRFDPDKKSSVKVAYHRFGLDSATDSWYGTSGVNAGDSGSLRDATGQSGRDVGGEFDLDYSLKLNAHQSFRAGFGTFKPGRFVRNLNASTKDENFGYIQWSYNF